MDSMGFNFFRDPLDVHPDIVRDVNLHINNLVNIHGYPFNIYDDDSIQKIVDSIVSSFKDLKIDIGDDLLTRVIERSCEELFWQLENVREGLEDFQGGNVTAISSVADPF